MHGRTYECRLTNYKITNSCQCVEIEIFIKKIWLLKMRHYQALLHSITSSPRDDGSSLAHGGIQHFIINYTHKEADFI